MTRYKSLEIEIDEHVAEIRLARPELFNRIDMLLHRELTAAFGEVAANPEVHAVLLTSTGKYFSAGGDTEVMLEAAGNLAKRFALIDEGRRLFRAIADLPKPLVTALEGNCYGLGSTLVLASDAIVTAPDIEFSDPHVVMALVAGDGGAVTWPSVMGLIKAKRHLLTGDPINGAEAHRLGVVTDLVETIGEVRPTALALAKRIASLPPVAVQLTKRALNKALMARTDELLDLGFYLEAITFGSDDLNEAVAAFKDKRKPAWKGN